jgi:hypothetical protein
MSKLETCVRYLRERYCLPHYALFFEVQDKIGLDMKRRADAIAVCLSDGSTICFEIKVSRGDWIRELKQPEKSACFAEQCNEFYIVATSDVLHLEEIPEGYGWIDPLMSRKQKKAVRRDVEVSNDLMAVLLRSAALTCEKYERVCEIVQSSLFAHVKKGKRKTE